MLSESSAVVRPLLVFFLSAMTLSIANGDESVSLDWVVTATGTDASLRGLSAVDDRVVWASGSNATVIRTRDGGKTWTPCGPKGFGDLEFRCVHALEEDVACIASAGSPAVLLRTDDGGASWEETYRASSPSAFFDAMRFWDSKRGIAISDPVDGKLLVVETSDGGQTWKRLTNELPRSRPGEAAFAASNSSLHVGEQGQLWFGTGGSESETSRLYLRSAWDAKWTTVSVPIPSSQASGIFSVGTVPTSIAGEESNTLVLVGGDYRASETSDVTACISHDRGVTWRTVKTQPAAFRSAVIAIPQGGPFPSGLITVGPFGTDFSRDADEWESLTQTGFHALAVGQTQVFASGSEGRFGRLIVVGD
ncbi:WD40/YVTN/BNR-like repeat-containing protein [Aporhodopirellula aestuarii]|uniref:YCF48-related protein n=1 Tax=Aporhodopirellula aestuarii TaxID=2950107 RepID=A0ABT0U8Y0_9BACT|nr:YCF48-related protein [Aporhodopirellula aestuarii]MCM2373336.1 YCF48-related protein [Aporhodopirellula aestuarii]